MELAVKSYHALTALYLDPLHVDYKQFPGYRNDLSDV